ncbi:MAG: MOSC N-terminal beta barrel domain-containing protein [Bryobacterales bacterium]|nr:MOSC N-terminal beta barrel domain-containing protein [Bryobacterales bacterium]
MSIVRQLRVYPIKSLDPALVDEADVLASGALQWDRRFALFDAQGRVINGKGQPRLHLIRAAYDLANAEVALDGRAFSLTREGPEIAAWFTARLDQPVEWREDAAAGFPDDTVSPGPTLITDASINAVAQWFGLEADEVRLRFRANVEIEDEPPFGEDAWYGHTLMMGEVAVQAVNPCQRCAVPSRQPFTGAPDAGFQRRFADYRREHLPAWAAQPELFTHTYRLAVNTRIPATEAGKTMRVGAVVAVA